MATERRYKVQDGGDGMCLLSVYRQAETEGGSAVYVLESQQRVALDVLKAKRDTAAAMYDAASKVVAKPGAVKPAGPPQ